MKEHLLEMLEKYKKEKILTTQFSKSILMEGYKWARASSLIGAEDASEFYLLLENHIPKIVSQYNPDRSGFRNYLSMCFRSHAMHRFRTNRKYQNKEQIYASYLKNQIDGFVLQEHSVNYPMQSKMQEWLKENGEKLKELPLRRREIYQKRILCLLLYYFAYLPEKYFPSLSQLAGISEKELLDFVTLLQEKNQDHMQKLRQNQIKLNHFFISYKVQELLLDKTMDERKRKEYHQKMEYYKNRLENYRNKRESISVNATHKELSTLLNMPSGTIGSSIHYARKFLTPLSTDLFYH